MQAAKQKWRDGPDENAERRMNFEFSKAYLRNMHSMEEKLAAFERLLKIMTELREKCPWDRKQTMESLRHLSIEETYELSEAI